VKIKLKSQKIGKANKYLFTDEEEKIINLVCGLKS
jgi:hypothetical protein